MEGRIGDFVVAAKKGQGFSFTTKAITIKDRKYYSPRSDLYTLDCNKDEAIRRNGVNPNWTDISDSRDLNGVEKPRGEWNTLEFEVNNGKISVWLNGEFINEAIDYSPRKGRIQIQSEGAEIFYKSIEILPL